jgi:hypothetical protein
MRLAFLLTLGIAVGSSLRCLVRPASYLTLVDDPSRAPAQLIVAAPPAADAFATLAEALQHAQPGDHILVQADTWQESLSLDGTRSLPAGLHIIGQAPGGRPVLWRAPAGHPADQPLLHLSCCSNLTLAGFTFDGQDRLLDGVVADGACASLHLQDLHLRGFQRHGLVLRGCHGSAELPLCLRRLRFSTEASSPAALLLEALAGQSSRQVLLHDCRFEGPYQAAIEVRGPSEDVVLQHNRIYRAAAGLRSSAPGQRAHLVLAGNTFCSLAGPALLLAALPDREHSHLQLTRNLFVNTSPLARLDGLSPEEARQAADHLAAGAFGNVCDRPDQQDLPPFHSSLRVVTLDTQAADDAHFLRYPATTFVGDEAPGVLPADVASNP